MNIKEKIGKRIATARKQAGLTIKQLADQTISLKPARIGNWEQGTRTPGVQEVKQLATVLSVSPAYLLCLTEDDKAFPQVTIPLLDSQQAIHYKDLFDKSKAADLEKPTFDQIPVGKMITDIMGDYTFAMTIDDESMSPDFKPGEIIIIDPDKKPNPGQYVIAAVENEEKVLFRKFRDRDITPNGMASFELVPLNSDWATITIDNKHHKAQIIGTMLEHRRRG